MYVCVNTCVYVSACVCVVCSCRVSLVCVCLWLWVHVRGGECVIVCVMCVGETVKKRERQINYWCYCSWETIPVHGNLKSVWKQCQELTPSLVCGIGNPLEIRIAILIFLIDVSLEQALFKMKITRYIALTLRKYNYGSRSILTLYPWAGFPWVKQAFMIGSEN